MTSQPLDVPLKLLAGWILTSMPEAPCLVYSQSPMSTAQQPQRQALLLAVSWRENLAEQGQMESEVVCLPQK